MQYTGDSVRYASALLFTNSFSTSGVLTSSSSFASKTRRLRQHNAKQVVDQRLFPVNIANPGDVGNQPARVPAVLAHKPGIGIPSRQCPQDSFVSISPLLQISCAIFRQAAASGAYRTRKEPTNNPPFPHQREPAGPAATPGDTGVRKGASAPCVR